MNRRRPNQYAYGVALDDGSQYVYGAGLESMLTASGTYYYLADGLGSTMAMVDSTGTVQKSYTYDVYGKPTATGALANEFDFAAQQTDPTGLQYLRARYMDPETGTFLSRDPLNATPGWNGHPMAYAGGNPVRVTDPTGLCDDTRTDGCEGGEIYVHTVDPYGDALPIGHFVDDVSVEGYRECFFSHFSNSVYCEWKGFDTGSDGSNWMGDVLDASQCNPFRVAPEYCAAHQALKWCAQDAGCRGVVDDILSGGEDLQTAAGRIVTLVAGAGLLAKFGGIDLAAVAARAALLLKQAALPTAIVWTGWGLYKAAYESPREPRKRVY